ncbi:MAG: hypothetical protein ACR2QE_18700 [Acidimicrobiales bacterium]
MTAGSFTDAPERPASTDDAEPDDDLGLDPLEPAQPIPRGRWSIQAWLTLAIVAGSAVFILIEMHPQLIFSSSTPTGGDMGAHVWGPAYLRDELLPNWQLSGWTPDWYAGFPAFRFYMVLPSLAIVGLNAGVGIIPGSLLIASIGLLAYVAYRQGRVRLAVAVGVAGGLALLLVSMPYGMAFKVVAVSGLVTMPITGWAMGYLARVPFPGAPMLAVATLPFVFDRSFNIYGGNAASTMAGEFAFSISLSASLLAIGLVARGLRTGRGRALTAVVLAVVVLCHLLPMIFVAIACTWLFVLRVGRGQMQWAFTTVPVALLLSAFWLGPFYLRREFLNDMGWGKTGGFKELSDWGDRWDVREEWEGFVSPLLSRSQLNPDNILVDSPPLEVVLALAVVGLVASIVTRTRLGVALGLSAITLAIVFIVLPEGRLWNARLLPFYYLTLYLLAGLAMAFGIRGGAWLIKRAVASSTDAQMVSAISAGAIGLVAGIPLGGLFVWIDRGTDVFDSPGVLLPLFFLATWLVLVALAVSAAWFLSGTPGRDGPSTAAMAVRTAGAAVVTGLVLVLLGMNLGSLPGGDREPGTFSWGPFTSNDISFVPGWAEWNFEGYQGREGNWAGGGWDEYSAVVATMEEVGETYGCGRSFWEFEPQLNRYGTTMALMLLPFWSDSCIGSMEGLYFESSATVPYHFLLQSELSGPSYTDEPIEEGASTTDRGGPSRAQRDLPYRSFDIDRGVEHLQLLGVRYYMAFSPTALEAARAHPDLTEIDGSGPWRVFLVDEAELVVPLQNEPIRVPGLSNHQDEWLETGVEFFQEPESWDVFLTNSGPDEWLEQGPDEEVLPRPVEPVVVTDIETTNDTISFSVDQVGSPVLVKTSYFPNWTASGADGPWRVTPNLMVVVPTATEVTLEYGNTSVEWVSYLATLVGLVGLAGLVVLDRRAQTPPEPWWDPVNRWFRRDPDPSDSSHFDTYQLDRGQSDGDQSDGGQSGTELPTFNWSATETEPAAPTTTTATPPPSTAADPPALP